MRIQFCGADRTVTGSSHLIEANGLRVFLDMGLYQGARDEARRINSYLPADVKSADAIVLSHGHLDHCGKLPIAVRAGFKGPVYCTPATAEVARIVLNDAAKIQQEDIDHLNGQRGPRDEPLSALYGPNDIPGVTRLFKRVAYKEKTDLGKGVSFTFFDAGHILGSAYAVLEWIESGKPHKLLFTADVGRYGAPILCDPYPLPGAMDWVITESTYGTVSHGQIGDVEPQLLDAVRFCIERKSRLLVPSFAVGRTQTMLWYMRKFVKEGAIPSIPVFVDSPMGVETSRITSQFSENYDEETRAMLGEQNFCGLDNVTCAASSDQSKQINSRSGPMVIIASSPTCEFGRILHHLERSVGKANDLVVFVGWIPPQTLGASSRTARSACGFTIDGTTSSARCGTIHGLSAHADGDELLRFLKPTLAPQTSAFIVHGEVPQAEGFAQRLIQAGIGSASVPAMETSMLVLGGTGKAVQMRAPGRTDQD